MHSDENKKTNPIQVAGKLFAVVEVLADQGAMGLMELSKQLEVNKTTMHRLLASLSALGYVCQDNETGRYQLSFKICALAGKVTDQLDVIPLLHPVLEELSRKSGETVHLVKLTGTEAVYIDKLESQTGSIRLISHIGMTIPLYCSGVGKAILSDLSDSEICHIWEQSQILPLTSHTITDFSLFQKEIQHIRKNGYALDREENETGVHCIAVSLHDYRDYPSYAVSISGPLQRMTKDKIRTLIPLLQEAKQELQHLLGC